MLTCEEFNALLAERGTLVIDGALATELENRKLDLNHPLWSAKILDEDPDSIKHVHVDYFLAGADIAITASYQASIQGFKDQLGMDKAKASELITKSVRLAQQAVEEANMKGIGRSKRLWVAGSVGPFGAFLADGSEYRGDYFRSRHEYKEFHRPRIQALVDAGVDLLAIETMPNFPEIDAVLDLLGEEFPSAIAWLSFTLRDSTHISDGTALKDVLYCINGYDRKQIVAVGVNCVPTRFVTEDLHELRKITDLPLLCYPNSGESWNAGTNTWSGAQVTGDKLDQYVRDWTSAGARLIGGCCRTGPRFIKEVAEVLKTDEKYEKPNL